MLGFHLTATQTASAAALIALANLIFTLVANRKNEDRKWHRQELRPLARQFIVAFDDALFTAHTWRFEPGSDLGPPMLPMLRDTRLELELVAPEEVRAAAQIAVEFVEQCRDREDFEIDMQVVDSLGTYPATEREAKAVREKFVAATRAALGPGGR